MLASPIFGNMLLTTAMRIENFSKGGRFWHGPEIRRLRRVLLHEPDNASDIAILL
jgi:hypothetical protein